MDHLPHLFESFVNLTLGPLHSFLREIDGIGQQPTTFFQVPGICSLFDLNAFGFKKFVHVLEQLTLFNRFHKFFLRCHED